ncbi:MAG: chemotaxis protein CheA [Ignavibacteriae bacterium]|nr:chemotaxis protein CheA [Ignavibacteriota bacterium]
MADYSLLVDPEMEEIFESFIVETKEILEKLDTDLVKLESTPDDADLLNEIFRSFHTIKGTSGFLGLEKLQKLTHNLEDILNKLRKGEAKITTPIMDALLDSFDALNELLDVVENDKNENFDTEPYIKNLKEVLASMEGGTVEEPAVVEQEAVVEEKVEVAQEDVVVEGNAVSNDDEIVITDDMSDEQIEQAFIQANKKAAAAEATVVVEENVNNDEEIVITEDMTDEQIEQAFIQANKKTQSENSSKLAITGEAISGNETDVIEAPSVENSEPIEVTLKDKSNTTSISELKEEAKKEVSSPKPKVENKKPSKPAIEQTIRVDVERLDELLNIVSEIVLGRNRLTQTNEDFAKEQEGTELARNLGDTTRQLDLLTTQLQQAVMKTRMIRIGKVFNKFPRLVRDLSKETGKKVQLVIEGEKTELDKTLIEEINDPLVHLIRNSVDHGVETPEDRVKAGKDPKGTVTLSAEHEGNHIIITIADDGAGINPEVLKNKSIEKGILTKEKADEMTDKEAFNLIFAPGFSTAAKVTNVSGRGVGMDVVKTNVTRLRGLIDIESELGEGTNIIIKLPLTLAIIQGLLIEIIGETIVIPLNSVIEVITVTIDDIYPVNKTECIRLRDRVIPLINIDQLLYHTDTVATTNEDQYVVIIGLAEKQYGIKVDNLIGQKEIVIKSLGKYLGNIEGIAGSTIMGDGKVVMIADIAELINKIADKNE